MGILSLLKTGSSHPISMRELMKQQLFWMLLLRVILYTLLLILNLILLDERFDVVVMPPSLLVLFTLGVYIVTIASAFVLLHSYGEFRRFSFIQTLLDVLIASVLVYLSGGSQSIFTSVYFFPIISGGLLIPIKGGLIGAASSTLLFGMILGLEHFSYLPDYLLYFGIPEQQSLFNSINHFATKGLTFFLAAVISALFGARLRSTTEALSSTRYDFDRLSLLYKQIFDNINTGILTIDKNNTITSANNATSGITGLHISEMVGRQLHDIFPAIDLGNAYPRKACDFEQPGKQKIRIGYAHSSLLESRHEKESETQADDDIIIITLKDISEIERLEGQMRQAEKLAAIGMMSASIAHDFRNPLAAISGSAQILAHEFADSGSDQTHNYELTKIILRESDRLTKTIADFLRFARPDNIKSDWFFLRSCIEEVLQTCTADPKWPGTADISIDVDRHYRVWADEKQMFTVISHLIYNGLAFCPKGDERMEVRGNNLQDPDRNDISCITVSDNGSGIDPVDLKKIFEPFYTTRPDGTGLGLAIVKQTIEAHNGYITVGRSELGGACFSLYLPIPGSDQSAAA